MDSSADFPNEIDLGRKENGLMPASAKESKGKPRTYYPTLYIDAIPGLENLPKEGCMMVKFRRKSLRLEEGGDGKDTAGATLEIQKICLPDVSEDGETLEDAFKKLARGDTADDNEEYADTEE